MSQYSAMTMGGMPWTPEFVTLLDPESCIACGRCYKVCPRDVLTFVDSDDDDDEDASAAAKMIIKDANDCIGCGACGRMCPKNSFTFAPKEV